MHIAQTASRHFEIIIIHICSVHNLVTASEFDYGLSKLLCVGMWQYEDLSQHICYLGHIRLR